MKATILPALVGFALMATAAFAAPAVPVPIQPEAGPESMTATSDGTLIASSLLNGVLYRAKPGDALATAWTPKQPDGPQNITGVFADERTGTVWACYSDLKAFGGKQWTPAIARAYDFKTAALKASYPLPDRSFCNDFTSAADGTVYITDTFAGRVLRLKPGASALETWFTDPALQGVNGLSLDGKGALYVNNEMRNTLFRIDIGADGSAGKLTELALSMPILSPDGMRFGDDGVLYLAEDGLTVDGKGRVDAIRISGDKAEITPLSTSLDTPTSVTKVGDTLWVLESKLSALGAKRDPGQARFIPIRLGAQ